MLEPIAVENLGALSCSTLDFLVELRRRICSRSGDVSENSYLLQRISDAALQLAAFARYSDCRHAGLRKIFVS